MKTDAGDKPGWVKCEATKCGDLHLWYNTRTRLAVVFSGNAKRWMLQNELSTIEYFDTDKAAMEYADKLYSTEG
jgi:hypothetical protein